MDNRSSERRSLYGRALASQKGVLVPAAAHTSLGCGEPIVGTREIRANVAQALHFLVFADE